MKQASLVVKAVVVLVLGLVALATGPKRAMASMFNPDCTICGICPGDIEQYCHVARPLCVGPQFCLSGSVCGPLGGGVVCGDAEM
jgi:hypothetical protein